MDKLTPEQKGDELIEKFRNESGCGNKHCRVCYPYGKEPKTLMERIINANTICKDIMNRIVNTIR